jgi:hypothetical protein
MADAKPVACQTLISSRADQGPGGRAAVHRQALSAQLNGKLMFLGGCNRPGIMKPVGALAQYMAEQRQSHWHATKHMLRYLCGISTLGLRY